MIAFCWRQWWSLLLFTAAHGQITIKRVINCFWKCVKEATKT